jgi:hypothetical protein
MKTTKTTKAFLAGAAIAGLLSGSATRLHAAASVTSHNGGSIVPGVMADEGTKDTDKDKHACKGKNGCKGQGGCKSGDNGCKGKNACKGKGGCATDGSKPTPEPKE